MKSKLFTINAATLVLLVSCTVKSPAPEISPAEERNCAQWKTESGSGASLEEIYEVVYLYSREKTEHIPACVFNPNRFARELARNPEALRYLKLAKRCESLRKELGSPWHYHYPADPDLAALRDLYKEALTLSDGPFGERYLLQAVRAMHSLGMHDEMDSLWAERNGTIQDTLIKEMIQRYIPACQSEEL